MKLIKKETFYSVHCSTMFRIAKTRSMQPRPLRNLVYYCLNSGSMALSIILRSTLQKTLLGMDWDVMPCQLPQLLRSSLFGILNISPMNQSLKNTSRFQILAKSSVSTKDAVMVSSFSYSAWSESILKQFHLGQRGLVSVNVEIVLRVIRLWQVTHFFEMLNQSFSLFPFQMLSLSLPYL